MPGPLDLTMTFAAGQDAVSRFTTQIGLLQERLNSIAPYWPSPRVSAMLSADDAIQLRGLRSDFWLGIDGPEVVIRGLGGDELKFSCDYDRAIKARMCVVGFPWKEIREGVRVDFAVSTNKPVYFQAEDADQEQYIGHLYVHVRQPDGHRRSYLIQAADFNPYIKN